MYAGKFCVLRKYSIKPRLPHSYVRLKVENNLIGTHSTYPLSLLNPIKAQPNIIHAPRSRTC